MSIKKALWEELLQYYPVTTDLKEAQQHKEEFHVAFIITGLDLALEPLRLRSCWRGLAYSEEYVWVPKSFISRIEFCGAE